MCGIGARGDVTWSRNASSALPDLTMVLTTFGICIMPPTRMISLVSENLTPASPVPSYMVQQYAGQEEQRET
jgi:hypothetical protein